MTRMTLEDVLKDDFYQIPKIIFWEKKYREGLSDSAKILYALIRDRISLSISTTKEEIEREETDTLTFVDENNQVFCILDNIEIQFILNKSDKTVRGCLKNLEDVGLIEIDRRPGRVHRIYLLKLEETNVTLLDFLGSKDYYKYVEVRKKKKQPIEKTEEQFINARYRRSNNVSRGGGKNYLTSVGETTAPSSVKTTAPSVGEFTAPVGEILPTSNTNTNNTNSNQNNFNQNYYTSSRDLEEEYQNNSQVDFELLDYMLDLDNLFVMKKDRNVIKKILRENEMTMLYKESVRKAIAMHEVNLLKYENETGEVVRYPPAFFAGFLVDLENRIRREKEKDIRKINKESEQRERDLSLYYDWLNES